MNDEQISAEFESPAEDALQFYRSLTTDKRELERDIINVAMEHAVIPDVARYGDFRGTCRGVIKSVSGEMFYFHIPPNNQFHLVKADTPEKQWEANKLLKSLDAGFDLIKAQVEEEDLEDEKKAAPAGGGAVALPPASRPEADDVASQNSQITTNHPGATVAQTPEQDGSAERWHGSGHIERALPPIDPTAAPNNWSTNDLIKAWGEQIVLHAPSSGVEPKQRQFMIEVLGKTPNEVDNGRVKLTPYQRAQFNQWSHKSLHSHMNPLLDWIAKSRGNES